MDDGSYLLGHLPHFAQSAVPLGTLVDERQKRERHTESIVKRPVQSESIEVSLNEDIKSKEGK
jgi:hypothetical protein